MWALLRRSGRVNAPQLIGAMVAITAVNRVILDEVTGKRRNLKDQNA